MAWESWEELFWFSPSRSFGIATGETLTRSLGALEGLCGPRKISVSSEKEELSSDPPRTFGRENIRFGSMAGGAGSRSAAWRASCSRRSR